MVRLRSFVLCAATVISACGMRDPDHHFLYSKDVSSLDNPFPDARLITADGMKLERRPDWYRPFLMPGAVSSDLRAELDAYAAASAELDGANNFGPTLIRATSDIELPPIGNDYVSRLVKVGDHYEVLERHVRISNSRESVPHGGQGLAGYPDFIMVSPRVPMPPGADGLLVFRSGFRTTDEYDLVPSPEFVNEDGSTKLIDAAAKALNTSPQSILLALPIHAQQTLPTMQALAQFTADMPAPAYSIPPHGTIPDGTSSRIVGVWTPADPDWPSVDAMLARRSFNDPASDVGQVISGTFKALDLRNEGVFSPGLVANPALAPAVDIGFTLVLPKGPKPSGGYKVVIGAHGFNGRNTVRLGDPAESFCVDVGELLARNGLGCLGIDAPSHGTRGDPQDLFSVATFRQSRDAFRQMAFDQMQLAKLATVIDVDSDGTPDLAPELGYFGTSLGGIMGANFMSLDPRVKYGVLNGAGGDLYAILNATNGLSLAAKTGLSESSPEAKSSLPLIQTVGQLFLEKGDPLNVGEGFRAQQDRALLVQHALGDRIVPDWTADFLAGSLGVEAATTSVSGGGPVRALVRIDPSKFPGTSFDAHDVFWQLEDARTQVVDFLGSSGTTLTVK